MVDVIVAGKNNIAVDILSELIERNDVERIYVIFNGNDNGKNSFQRSFKKYCESLNVTQITLEEAETIEDAVFLSLEFDKIVKPQNFKSKRLFNIHFSLLPKYKGMYTSAWPILNHEKETGVTLHEIDAGIDTGRILSQEAISIEDNDTAKDLYLKYIKYGTDLVSRNLDGILNDQFTSAMQTSENSTYFSKVSLDYSNVEIELRDTAFNIKKKIQAFTFRDFQLVKVKGYSVFGAEILKVPSMKKPGETLNETVNYIDVATIDFDLRIYKDTFSTLLDACEKSDMDTFLKASNDFNILEKNEYGWSPIIVAAYNGSLNIVKALMEMGASVNDTNNNGTSVLMYAKDYTWKSKDTSLFDYLLSKGADINHRDYSGKKLIDYLNEPQKKFFKLKD
ncbi:formyltransferase family protein [Vibrio maritimus]|uniref:formyltransferase family protein n=1 Tax=Vibrio maritimus TaxID=990268 RepID=UPI003736AA8E